MTFELKELNEIRDYFDETVRIYLKQNKKGQIEDLPSPRKYELQFLSELLTKLETQESPLPASPQTIFYGAMLAIIKDIDNQRSSHEKPGYISTRLAEFIGVAPATKPEDRPNLYDLSKCHRALNAFLNQFFEKNDSRQGFAKEHMPRGVPTDDLNVLMKTSYKLEKETQLALIASLKADGRSSVRVEEYVGSKNSPSSATEQFESLAQLNADIDNLFEDEQADKVATQIGKVSQDRATHLHLIDITRKNLNNAPIDESEKIAILAGVMHLVRQQIIKEYEASVKKYVSKVENSVIYKGLSKILGVDTISPQDMEALVFSASQFIRFLTIEKANNKKSIQGEHIYSGIAGFDLKSTLTLLVEMIHNCRAEALKTAVEEFKKQEKPVEKHAAGFFGSTYSALSSFSPFSKKSAEDEDDDVLEHKSAVHI